MAERDINIQVTLQDLVKDASKQATELGNKAQSKGKFSAQQQANLGNNITQLGRLSQQMDFSKADLRSIVSLVQKITGQLNALHLALGEINPDVTAFTNKIAGLEKEIRQRTDALDALQSKVSGNSLTRAGARDVIDRIQQSKTPIVGVRGKPLSTETILRQSFHKDAQGNYDQLDKMKFPPNFEEIINKEVTTIQQRIEAEQAIIAKLNEQLATTKANAPTTYTDNPVIASNNKKADAVVKSAREAAKAKKEATTENEKFNTSIINGTKAIENHSTTLGKAFKHFTLYSIAMRALRRALREAIRTVRELDKSLTEQAMVTGLTREQTYGLVKDYQELALQVGATTKEVASVATEYMKQGKTVKDSMILTKAAISAAKVARVSVGDSVNYLTTALNGFRLSAEDAMLVSDKFAAVAASSATDYDELAIALSKVASQANLAGMSIDYTTALLTKGLETTREAPETMGTALKTIIARMREMTDYGKTLSDGVDVNNVETQLQYVGIALRQSNGELRSTEEVLDELGRKWDTLSTNQQAAVAKALAGTRQQSRLIALMDGYERVIELQEISERSEGATMAQADTYLSGLEASINKVSVAWEKVITTLTDSDVIIGIVSGIGSIIDHIAGVLSNPAGMLLAMSTLSMLGLRSLNQAFAKYAINKQLLQIQRQETLAENEAAIATAKQNLEAKKEAAAQAKILVSEREITVEDAKQALLTAQKNGASTAAIKQAQDALFEAKQQLAVAKEQEVVAKQAYEAEKVSYQTTMPILQAKNALYKQQASSIFNISSGLGVMLLNLKMMGNGFKQAIAGLGRLIGLRKVDTAAVAANTEAEKKNALVKSAGSAAGLPAVGWIASLGFLILAGVTTILPLINSLKSSFSGWFKGEESPDEAVSRLNNEIFKLKESNSALQSIAKEFETIDNKVIKTADDMKRLGELANSAAEKIDFTEGGKNDETVAAQRKTEFLMADVKSQQEWLQAQINENKEQIMAGRQKQVEKYFNLSVDERAKKAQDGLYAGALKGAAGDRFNEELDKRHFTAEKEHDLGHIGRQIIGNLTADTAAHWAKSPEIIKKFLSSLTKLSDGTIKVLSGDGSLRDIVKAYDDLINNLDTDGIEALDQWLPHLSQIANFSPQVLDVLDDLGITIEEINDLASVFTEVGLSAEQAFVQIEHFLNLLKDGKTIPEAIGIITKGLGIEDGGFKQSFENTVLKVTSGSFQKVSQDITQFKNKIKKVWQNAFKWNSMTAVEQQEFMNEHAGLFEGDAGERFLEALTTGNYKTIQEAIANNFDVTSLRKMILTQMEQATSPAEKKQLEKFYKETFSPDLYNPSLEDLKKKEDAQLREYKDFLQRQRDLLRESLEEQKKAYEDYFKDIAHQEDQEDYNAQRKQLIENITKLGATTNANTNAQRAELEAKLVELDKEQAKKEREKAQEALLSSIDDTIEQINERMDKILNNNQMLYDSLQESLKIPGFLATMVKSKDNAEGFTDIQYKSFVEEFANTFGTIFANADWRQNANVTNQNANFNINGTNMDLTRQELNAIFEVLSSIMTRNGQR